MKSIIISIALVFVSFVGYANNFLQKNKLSFADLSIQMAKVIPVTADPCLDAALNAQNQAFAFESNGWNWCSEIHSTGPGYLDCAHAFTVLRQQMVAYIQSTYVPCPSGSGYGIA